MLFTPVYCFSCQSHGWEFNSQIPLPCNVAMTTKEPKLNQISHGINVTCFPSGPGFWAGERVHSGTECSEPCGTGEREVWPCIHRHCLHLHWWHQRGPCSVTESLRGHCQRGRRARTGHSYNQGLRPRLPSSQARALQWHTWVQDIRNILQSAL